MTAIILLTCSDLSMISGKYTIGFANWLSFEHLKKGFSDDSQEILEILFINIFSEYSDQLTPQAMTLIIDYFYRFIKNDNLENELKPFLDDLTSPLGEDAIPFLALIYAINFCLKYMLDDNPDVDIEFDYTLKLLQEMTPELDGLRYSDCEVYFLNLLDWNLTAKYNETQINILYSKMNVLAHYYVKKSTGTIHPWQLHDDSEVKEMLTYRNASKVAYSILNQTSPMNMNQKRMKL